MTSWLLQFLVCNQSLEIQKDNGMAAMLDDKTKRSVIQHGCHVHHCLLDLQGLVANQELGVEQLRFQLVLVKSLTINKEKIKKSFL